MSERYYPYSPPCLKGFQPYIPIHVFKDFTYTFTSMSSRFLLIHSTPCLKGFQPYIPLHVVLISKNCFLKSIKVSISKPPKINKTNSQIQSTSKSKAPMFHVGCSGRPEYLQPSAAEPPMN